MLSPVPVVEDINKSSQDCVSVAYVPSYSSRTLWYLDSVSISFISSVVSMFSGRELGSNTSSGYTASIYSSDSSSSIILITENE